jgi:hypothetical protein
MFSSFSFHTAPRGQWLPGKVKKGRQCSRYHTISGFEIFFVVYWCKLKMLTIIQLFEIVSNLPN